MCTEFFLVMCTKNSCQHRSLRRRYTGGRGRIASHQTLHSRWSRCSNPKDEQGHLCSITGCYHLLQVPAALPIHTITWNEEIISAYSRLVVSLLSTLERPHLFLKTFTFVFFYLRSSISKVYVQNLCPKM